MDSYKVKLHCTNCDKDPEVEVPKGTTKHVAKFDNKRCLLNHDTARIHTAKYTYQPIQHQKNILFQLI